MEIRSMGFRTDVMVRRLGGAQVVDADDHVVVRSADNPTFFWGNFLLLPGWPPVGALGHWVGTSERAFPGATHVALGVDGPAGDEEEVAALAAAGFVCTTSVVLTTTDVRAPAHPVTGVDIRPLTSRSDWAEYEEMRRTQDPDLAVTDGPFLAGKAREAQRLGASGVGATFAARIDGTMAATVGVCVEDGTARFQDVGTLPGYRRRGLAATLVHRAGRWAVEQRRAVLLVIVADPAGPAVELYRSLGFAHAERQVELLRGAGAAPGPPG